MIIIGIVISVILSAVVSIAVRQLDKNVSLIIGVIIVTVDKPDRVV